MHTRGLCLLLSVVLASGCTTTHALSAKEIARLDGFDADTTEGRVRVVAVRDGTPIVFSSDWTLRVRLVDGELGPASYRRIEVRPDLFRATLLDGHVVTVSGLGRVIGGEMWKGGEPRGKGSEPSGAGGGLGAGAIVGFVFLGLGVAGAVFGVLLAGLASALHH
jgi:hypothetical protein